MARYFHDSGHILRFIEFMDVGNSNAWDKNQVVSAQQIVDTIHKDLPIEPADPNYHGEVAKRWFYKDGKGEIGVISSVTEPFCESCFRIRLSAVGSLYNCLFATQGHDLRTALRGGCSDADITARIRDIWGARTDRYSETRSQVHIIRPQKIEMSFIGG
jgi:cyclic pyranopterin phosphate synthase